MRAIDIYAAARLAANTVWTIDLAVVIGIAVGNLFDAAAVQPVTHRLCRVLAIEVGVALGADDVFGLPHGGGVDRLGAFRAARGRWRARPFDADIAARAVGVVLAQVARIIVRIIAHPARLQPAGLAWTASRTVDSAVAIDHTCRADPGRVAVMRAPLVGGIQSQVFIVADEVLERRSGDIGILPVALLREQELVFGISGRLAIDKRRITAD